MPAAGAQAFTTVPAAGAAVNVPSFEEISARLGASSVPGTAPTPTPVPLKERLRRFYERRDPSKLGNIDTMVEHFEEARIKDILLQKYGETIE